SPATAERSCTLRQRYRRLRKSKSWEGNYRIPESDNDTYRDHYGSETRLPSLPSSRLRCGRDSKPASPKTAPGYQPRPKKELLRLLFGSVPALPRRAIPRLAMPATPPKARHVRRSECQGRVRESIW